MNSDQEIKDLFQKYLSDKLNPDEIKLLKKLVSGMDELSLDNQLQQLWDNYSTATERNIKAFDEISTNLKNIIYPEKQKRISMYLWRGVAAILLPVLFITTVYLLIERSSVESHMNQMYTASTDKGERASITLPDGTKVYLNSQTTLSYPASFALDSRIVKLSGEAYFEVAHNEKNPFVVHTHDLDIKVLGTTFNLYAYPDDRWIEAALVEGKVEAIPVEKLANSVLLYPGQKVRYNSVTKEIKVTGTDLRMETAWRKGDLIFRSESLQAVLTKLESFYGAKIETNGAYPEALFTGSFHETDIYQVLVNLQMHYNFSFEKSGKNIAIKFE